MQLEHKNAVVSADAGGGLGTAVIGSDESTGQVKALVSITGVVDRVEDIIEPGAYAETLAVRDPIGVWSHDDKTWVARANDVKELPPGDPYFSSDEFKAALERMGGATWPAAAGALIVDAQFNLETPHGRAAFSDVKFFEGKTGWSIGYRAKNAKRNPRTNVRHIKSLDLFEFSPVLVGAAAEAMTLSVKSLSMPVDAEEEPPAPDLADPEEVKALLAARAEFETSFEVKAATKKVDAGAKDADAYLDGKDDAAAPLPGYDPSNDTAPGRTGEEEGGGDQMPTIDTAADLRSALSQYSGTKDQSVIDHIVKRATELGLEDELPDGWGASKRGKEEDTSEKAAELALERGRALVAALDEVKDVSTSSGGSVTVTSFGGGKNLGVVSGPSLEGVVDRCPNCGSKARKTGGEGLPVCGMCDTMLPQKMAAGAMKGKGEKSVLELLIESVDTMGDLLRKAIEGGEFKAAPAPAAEADAEAAPDAQEDDTPGIDEIMEALSQLSDEDLKAIESEIEDILNNTDDEPDGDGDEGKPPAGDAEGKDDLDFETKVATMVHEPLNEKPGKNWVEMSGQLPAYIQHIAKDIHEKNGVPLSSAIPIAIAAVKRWASGRGGVNPDTRAKAAAAVVEWEKLRAQNKVRMAGRAVAHAAGKAAEAVAGGEGKAFDLEWFDTLDDEVKAAAIADAGDDAEALFPGRAAELETKAMRPVIATVVPEQKTAVALSEDELLRARAVALAVED